MREFIEKYKYYIGGSTATLLIFYLIYDTFVNKNNKIMDKPSVTFKEDKSVKAEISHDEFLLFMKTLKGELQGLTQSMIQFNANHIKTDSNYKDFRDKLFTKDIVKKNILIDSVSVGPDDTSNYVVNFGTDIYGEVFKNVIGFRLVEATLPNSIHNVTENNKTIYYQEGTDPIANFSLNVGAYKFDKLGQEFERAFNVETSATMALTPSTTTYKYTLAGIPANFQFKWKTGSDAGSPAYLLLGAENKDDTADLDTTSHVFPHIVDQTKHFVDLVIPEIPDIACKMASKKQVIDRIPLNSPSGTLVDYKSPEHELQTENYFYPMKLSSLTIQLYDNNSSNFYKSGNGHNYFEFEITIVKNAGLFK